MKKGSFLRRRVKSGIFRFSGIGDLSRPRKNEDLDSHFGGFEEWEILDPCLILENPGKKVAKNGLSSWSFRKNLFLKGNFQQGSKIKGLRVVFGHFKECEIFPGQALFGNFCCYFP